jgi:hypothetical protein
VTKYYVNSSLYSLCSETRVYRRDTECDLCKRTVSDVNQIVGDIRTEQNLVNALEDACSLASREDYDRCNSFVESNAEELVQILAMETDPGSACKLLGVCV